MLSGSAANPLIAIGMILLGLFAAGVVVTVLVMGIGLIFSIIGRVIDCIAGIVGDAFGIAINLLVMPFNLARAVVMLVFGRLQKADAAATRFHRNVLEIGRRCWSAVVQRPLRIVGVEVPPKKVRRGTAGSNAVSQLPAVKAGIDASQAAAPPRAVPGSAEAPPWPDPAMLLSGFPGYAIEGRLPAGGSGAKLFVASPDASKRAALRGSPPRVVIKSFAIGEGSTLPQIVRESRSLDAARSLGLVLDHAFEAHRFWYAMPHYDGPSLGQHASTRHRGISAASPLPETAQRELLSLVADVVGSLSRFHAAGLWHKDIKPDNIIVSNGRAQLIDVGLVTPLASSFTLTTHGTEYFRDPEMVRQALRGTKVNEIDGARFDLYSAGAVLYAVLENTFPAQGALSGFSKPSPEALRWIVRRAMADYSKRYESAEAMLADLRFVLASKDIASVRPADLPSMRGATSEGARVAPPPPPEPSLADMARRTADEAIRAARAATADATAAVRAAMARRQFRTGWSKRTPQAKSASPATPRQAWSPWATAAVAVAVVAIAVMKHDRRRSSETPSIGGTTVKVSSSSSRSGRRSSTKPSDKSSAPVVEPVAVEIPNGGGKLLVDRAALLGGLLPESLEAQAMAGIGSKGWSPITGDVEALAAIESLSGSSPETIRAELSRRGYSGLVRLETKGGRVIVKPVALPAP